MSLFSVVFALSLFVSSVAHAEEVCSTFYGPSAVAPVPTSTVFASGGEKKSAAVLTETSTITTTLADAAIATVTQTYTSIVISTSVIAGDLIPVPEGFKPVSDTVDGFAGVRDPGAKRVRRDYGLSGSRKACKARPGRVSSIVNVGHVEASETAKVYNPSTLNTQIASFSPKGSATSLSYPTLVKCTSTVEPAQPSGAKLATITTTVTSTLSETSTTTVSSTITETSTLVTTSSGGYAACQPTNILSRVDSRPLSNIHNRGRDEDSRYDIAAPATSAEECCTACFASDKPCQGSAWDVQKSECRLLRPQEEDWCPEAQNINPASFRVGAVVEGPLEWVVSNGPCGFLYGVRM